MIIVKILIISSIIIIANMKMHVLLVINCIINIVSDAIQMNVYNAKVIDQFHIVNVNNILQQQKITYMIVLIVQQIHILINRIIYVQIIHKMINYTIVFMKTCVFLVKHIMIIAIYVILSDVHYAQEIEFHHIVNVVISLYQNLKIDCIVRHANKMVNIMMNILIIVKLEKSLMKMIKNKFKNISRH